MSPELIFERDFHDFLLEALHISSIWNISIGILQISVVICFLGGIFPTLKRRLTYTP